MIELPNQGRTPFSVTHKEFDIASMQFFHVCSHFGSYKADLELPGRHISHEDDLNTVGHLSMYRKWTKKGQPHSQLQRRLYIKA